MIHLVDSDWIIDWLAGRAPAVRLLQSPMHEQLAISLMTFGEVYARIYYGADPEAGERGFRDLLHRVEVLPLDQEIMRRFARICGNLRRRGLLIGDPDVLIAATALHHGAVLATRNRDHFRRIPELQLL